MQRIKSRLWLVVGFVAGAGTACATVQDMGDNKASFPMEASSSLPAAQGKVAVTAKKDGQQRVTVEAKHLPPPERASEDALTYVVWLIPHGAGEAYNLGVLDVKDGKGKFETMTPFRDFRISVTAEPEPTVRSPRGKNVMTAMVKPAHKVY